MEQIRPIMRIFYLTSELPWPPISGGRVRSLAQLRLLASLPEVEEIRVLALRETAVPRDDLAALGREIPKAKIPDPVFHPIHLRAHPRYIPRVALTRITRRVPYLAAKWVGRSVESAIERTLRETRFDVVYIDHLGMAVYLAEMRSLARGARFVLEQHNVESDFFRQFAEKKTGLLRMIAHREWRSAKRFEKRILRKVDAVVAISSSDADAFLALSGIRANVVPQVVPLERRAWSSGRGPRVVYVGNLTWHPNVEGLDWFCEKVWPAILAEVPDATLTIAGSGLAAGGDGLPAAPEKWRVPGVRTVGFVEDLETLYRDAVLFIAPILGGSGVRIKLLEAFRAGLPLVTTVPGALGLPLEDGREAMIAKDEGDFARAVVRVCREEPLQNRLREAGYDYVEQNHGLAAAQKIMRTVLAPAR